ncbi:Isoquinoline 1-oxidoreductase subunit [uncultured Sphingomonas sp.]|uniref:Isoquinoline 1-oxidoreductase subunit n=1 Tax=uncultured Sphingomonas sp. TaxID=158754 RepID=UPI0025F0B400|nr:Isoquinoline 1-oxidoreductase subunit [uncultured Sphingomonas sp.]
MSARPRRRRRIGCLALLTIVVASLILTVALLLRPRTMPAPSVIPIASAEVDRVSLRPVAAFRSIDDPAARSIALFREAGRVIQHPRCLNCHPRSDRPNQTDAMRPHLPAVMRGPDGGGEPVLRCATCHRDRNVDAAGVPGSPNWRLAPAEMAWEDQSLGQICRQILDPVRSHMSRDELRRHMAEDELVGWAWHPGGDRAPAPGTQTEFGALIAAWLETGARCPA